MELRVPTNIQNSPSPNEGGGRTTSPGGATLSGRTHLWEGRPTPSLTCIQCGLFTAKGIYRVNKKQQRLWTRKQVITLFSIGALGKAFCFQLCSLLSTLCTSVCVKRHVLIDTYRLNSLTFTLSPRRYFSNLRLLFVSVICRHQDARLALVREIF